MTKRPVIVTAIKPHWKPEKAAQASKDHSALHHRQAA
jgi:hypothetical protein